MSDSGSPSHPPNDGGIPKGIQQTPQAVSLDELQQMATVGLTDVNKFQVKFWIKVTKNLYEKGAEYYQRGDINNAYMAYYKGCNVVLEVIPAHPGRAEVQKDPTYIWLRKITGGKVLQILEGLGDQIKKRFEEAKRQKDEANTMNTLTPASASSDTDAPNTGSDASTKVENDISLLDLPPVPTHSPTVRSAVPSSDTQPVKPADAPAATKATTATAVTENNVASKQTLPTYPSLNSTINDVTSWKNIRFKIPPRTNNVFPDSASVSPKQLASWITQKDNRPSILLLDVRPKETYLRGCIQHTWICQIEPLVLRPGVSSGRIQESLVLNPKEEQELFEKKGEFDLVVFYDQSSQSIHNASSELIYLKKAISDLEFGKPLRRKPMMLEGGFAAWKKTIGDRGVHQSEKKTSVSAQPTQAPPAKSHGFHSFLQHLVGKKPGEAGSERVKVHHTLYDYFGYKRLSPSTSVASSTTEPSSTPDLSASETTSESTTPLEQFSYKQSDLQNKRLESVDKTEISVKTQYPDIQPNTSSAPVSSPDAKAARAHIKRRGTFIDNPFYGFTESKTDLFDAPPVPAKVPLSSPPAPSEYAVLDPLPPRPSSADPSSAPPLPAKPAELTLADQPCRPMPPERDSLSSSSFSHLGVGGIGTTGLKNLGNTCYMNSIIQCLSGTMPLARYLISGSYKHHINKVNPLGTKGDLTTSFADLLRAMWHENSASFLSPTEFRKTLGRYAPQFAGTDQQDSQEFLNFLLDGLHEDVNSVVVRPPPHHETPEEEEQFERLLDWQQSSIAWEKYLARNSSIIVSLFQGQYRSKLVCLTCNRTSTTYSTFLSLSVPIPAKGKVPPSVTIYQCIDAFVKEEVLSGDDAWYCATCKKHVRATKKLTLSRLPDVLLIHLKRFSHDGHFRNKLETMVQSPTRGLDLSNYIPSSMQPPERKGKEILKYDLYGVSNHYGSLTGGHYTACVRNGYRNEWHYFDDTRFSICEEDNVMTRAAYNLFYVRSTVN